LKKIIKNYWKTALITLVISYLCFAPPKTFGNAPAMLFHNADKLVHFLMFYVLAIAIYLDYQRNTLNRHCALYAQSPENTDIKSQIQNREKVYFIVFCWIFPILFGLAIEGVQHFFIPLRQGDLKDWFFDVLGYVLGFFAVKLFYKNKTKINGTTN